MGQLARSVGAAAWLVALGCSSTADQDETSSGGLTTVTASGTDSATSDASASGGGDKFDVANGSDMNVVTGGDPGDMGCKKVDFLFVIDSSNSLKEEQTNLIGSFPGFVSGIQATLAEVDDFHVGVVTSDAYVFNEPGCTEIGALVTQTGGKESSMATCGPFAEGGRFMTEADDLATAFACTAQIGTGGANDERMLQAGTRAVAPDLNGPGMCNDGFIRPDALLVLVLITDEDDPGTCVLGNDCVGSPGDPTDWYDNFVLIKQQESNVVVLSLVWGAPNNVCGPAPGTEKVGDRVMQFTQLFSNGFIGDVCATSYDTFFQEAISVIDSACSDFTPPG